MRVGQPFLRSFSQLGSEKMFYPLILRGLSVHASLVDCLRLLSPDIPLMVEPLIQTNFQRTGQWLLHFENSKCKKKFIARLSPTAERNIKAIEPKDSEDLIRQSVTHINDSVINFSGFPENLSLDEIFEYFKDYSVHPEKDVKRIIKSTSHLLVRFQSPELANMVMSDHYFQKYDNDHTLSLFQYSGIYKNTDYKDSQFTIFTPFIDETFSSHVPRLLSNQITQVL